MKFLYIGLDEARAITLAQSFHRESIQLEQTRAPEHAYFRILHEEIAAIFIDLTVQDWDPAEILSNLEHLDKDLEIVLISEVCVLQRMEDRYLRCCFGFISPDVKAPINLMALSQLTDKISIKDRLEKLKNTAIIDGLTQLFNHAHIQQQLDVEIAHSRKNGDPLSLVLFDVDNFKNYNDTNGHPAGDRVLKTMSELLGKSVRKFDITARYGGEEFVILLPGTKLQSALMITERFRERVQNHRFEFGHLQPMGFVSASFGVAMLDLKDITDKKTLIEFADQALYRAKRSKRNCVWYYLHGDYHSFRPSLA